MKSVRRAALYIGILFLLTTITYGLGDAIIQTHGLNTNSLEAFSKYNVEIVMAVLLQLLCGMGVLGIAIIGYPIFKKIHQNVAMWYVSIRTIECTIIAIGAMYLLSGIKNKGEAVITKAALLTNYHMNFIMLALVLSFGAIGLYYLLYISRIVPKFIAIWGFLAVPLMVFALLFDLIYGVQYAYLYFPMGLNEIFLGFWLLIKGFNTKNIGFNDI